MATVLEVAVNKLAVNDKNQEKIINSGVLESYVFMLGVGNSNEEQLVAKCECCTSDLNYYIKGHKM